MVSILDNLYKVFQLSDVFISNYGYNQVVLDTFSSFSDKEAWLFNNNDPNYELIRITLNSASAFVYDADRINTYINYFKATYKKEIRFLDIHVNKDKHESDFESFPYANIDENYHDGEDIMSIYPFIKDVIHKVDDPKKEIMNIIDKMQKVIKERKKNLPFYKRNSLVATYSIIVICTIIYILTVLLSTKYNETTALIVLGADYMTFTKGLNQFYRFITAAFVHGGFIHLLSNMYSMYVLGRFVERNYGTLKYLLILFVCILVGSMSQAILSSNTITVGMSGGLYGLMVFFILDLIIYRKVPISSFMPLIFINLSINFLSTTAFIAHLGGAIAGYLMYLILNNKNNKGLIVLTIILILSLFIKYVTIKTISPFYKGTDIEVVKVFNDLGLKSYSNNLLKRLIEVYAKYGG